MPSLRFRNGRCQMRQRRCWGRSASPASRPAQGGADAVEKEKSRIRWRQTVETSGWEGEDADKRWIEYRANSRIPLILNPCVSDARLLPIRCANGEAHRDGDDGDGEGWLASRGGDGGARLRRRFLVVASYFLARISKFTFLQYFDSL